jgi:transcription elongation factor GreA
MAKVLRAVSARKSTYFTASGLENTRRELDFLKKTKRAEVADRISRARDLGDLAENAEYEAALDEQALVENKIEELEGVLRNAKVISEPQGGSEIVMIGSTVKVEMGGEIDEFTIVGKVEANPIKKKISNESPVGSALLGAKVGEEVEVATPIVRYKAKVLEIK